MINSQKLDPDRRVQSIAHWLNSLQYCSVQKSYAGYKMFKPTQCCIEFLYFSDTRQLSNQQVYNLKYALKPPIYLVTTDNLSDCCTNTRPYVLGALFVEILLGIMYLNGFNMGLQDTAFMINKGSSGTAGSNVNADKGHSFFNRHLLQLLFNLL